MDSQTLIMVNIGNRTWTMEALHCACLTARTTSARIALMKMVPVQHPGFLGTDFGLINFSKQDQQDMEDYEATMNDYGIEFSSHLFQYTTLGDAISQAALEIKADIVFATLPRSVIPLWHSLKMHWLRGHLAHNHCELIENPLYDQPLLPITEAVRTHA
jgi:hypothetical protein